MKTILPILAVALLVTACGTAQNAGQGNWAESSSRSGGDQPNILILGEDSDSDTVPRNSRVFKRVLDALSNEMNDEGFDVYDETAITLDQFVQGRVRRSDAEIIDIARSVKRPPIDVAVIYSIYTDKRNLGYTNKLGIGIEGRLLNVRSGQRLGNFEFELAQPENVSPSCTWECKLEAVGRNARVLASDLGAVLARKLDWLSPPSHRSMPQGEGSGASRIAQDGERRGLAAAYSLVFFGFSSRDITEVEDRIAAFSGYEHFRPVRSSLRTNEYWYETSSASARLSRNLRLMLEAMGVEGRVTYGGNRFMVAKNGFRKQR